MSRTISASRYNVRVNMGDLDAAHYAVSDEVLTRILVRQAQLHRGLTGPIETGNVQVSISNTGGYDFNLSVPISRESSVRRLSDGLLLTRRPREVIDALLSAPDAGNPPTGPPTDYCWIDQTGLSFVANIRLYPAPSVDDTLQIWSETLSAAAYTDATTLEGSEYLLDAIELATAAEAVARMTQPERDRLRLSPEVAGAWRADAQRFLMLERERHSRLTATAFIPAQVN